jgi:hypothetical protein
MATTTTMALMTMEESLPLVYGKTRVAMMTMTTATMA